MKILISADMEGITGVTAWDQVTPGHSEYPRFRKLMTADVNAAVRGAFDGGAKEVVVSDGHWNGSNILVEELDARAHLNTGSPSPSSMMQGIDETFQGVFFIGYHARQGSELAVLDHTWSSTCVANLWLNGVIAGEFTLNAAVAGHHQVPVLLGSGDQTACAQMVADLGSIETVVVKRATGRYAAQCESPETTAAALAQTSSKAVKRLANHSAPQPFILKPPIVVTVELFTSDMADRVMHMPGVGRQGLKLEFSAKNMPEAFSAFRSMVLLAYPR